MSLTTDTSIPDRSLPPAEWPALTIRQWVLVLALLAIGLALRCDGLGAFPRPHETDDEYHYLWAGLSLLSEGHPTSWSRLAERAPIDYAALGARTAAVEYEGHQYTLVCPALDHPPLFSLAAGAWARVTGAARPRSASLATDAEGTGGGGGELVYWAIDLARARTLTLLLYAATFLCLLTLVRRAFSFPAAMVALLLYTFVMHVVAHGRLLVTENLTAPLFLGNLVILQSYIAGRASRGTFAALTIVLTAAALLCKLIAVVQAGAIVLLLLLAGRPRAVLDPLLGCLLGLVLYLAYGWWQGWDVFRATLAVQAGRFQGFDALSRLIMTPNLVHASNFSFLIFAGWLALFAQLLNRRGAMLFLAPICYLLGFIFFIAVPSIYGWHIVPLYPFLCAALAVLIVDLWRDAKAVPYATLAAPFAALVILLVPYTLNVFFFALLEYGFVWRLLYLAVIVAALLLPLAGGDAARRTVRATLAAALAVALAAEYILLRIWTAGGS